MNFGFQEDDFESALEMAKAVAAESSKTASSRRYPAYRDDIRLGEEVKFAKGGRFTMSVANKKGNLVERTFKKLKAVVLNAGFYREKWGRTDGKPKFLCGTIEHTAGKNPDGTDKKGNGCWPATFYSERIDKMFDPVGMLPDPTDESKFLRCIDCKALGNNEGCSDKGFMHVAILGFWDDEEECFVDLAEPLIKTLSVSPKTSGRGYMDYRQALKDDQESIFNVVTVLGTKALEKLPDIYSLTLNKMEPLEDEDLVSAIKTKFEEAKAEIQAKKDQRYADWKARKGIESSTGSSRSTSKPAAKAPAAAATATSKVKKTDLPPWESDGNDIEW